MMKVAFLFLCLLVTSLHIFSLKINSSVSPSSSSSSMVLFIGRRCMEEKVSIHAVKKPVQKEGKIQETSEEPEYESSSNRLDELVYQIDYRGVTTHPTPTPKHPAP